MLDANWLRGRRVAVLGLGLSNIAVLRYLLRVGAKVTAADRKPAAELAGRLAEFANAPIRYALGPAYLDALAGQEVAVLTPGMRRDLPELAAAARCGVVFTSEIGLFFAACAAPVVGITGSAGKTTTTTLTGQMLQASRPNVWVGGNIGRPLLADVDAIKPEALVVLELSSFQLQDLRVSPQIAAVLNVNPNHLDMHPSMDDYVDAKRNIYRHQGADGMAVFGAANPVSAAMAGEYLARGQRWPAAAPPVCFSRQEELAAGAFARGEDLVLRLSPLVPGGLDGLICRRGDVKLLGEHNLDNILAAAAIAALAGAGLPAISGVASTFRGVEHRLEPVRVVRGVQYYNDSIATAPDRTIAALRALPGPLVLILGGYDKRIGFAELADEVVACGKVAHVLLQGATADQIKLALDEAQARLSSRGGAQPGCPPEVRRVSGDFRAVVEAAAAIARPGDTVLLSPACASFDQFSNFEERGAFFKQIVMSLREEGRQS